MSLFKSSSSNKEEIKIQFNIRINKIEGLPKTSANWIWVSWKRGKKIDNQGDSRRVVSKEGNAVFDQAFSIQASLLKDKKGQFQPKKIKFTITEEKEKEKDKSGKKYPTVIGSVEVDLAHYAEAKTERSRTFPISDKSKVSTSLSLSFQSQLLKINGKSIIKAENEMQKEIYSSMGKQKVNVDGEEYYLGTEHSTSEPDETDFAPTSEDHDPAEDDEEDISFEDDHPPPLGTANTGGSGFLSRKDSNLSSSSTASAGEHPTPSRGESLLTGLKKVGEASPSPSTHSPAVTISTPPTLASTTTTTTTTTSTPTSTATLTPSTPAKEREPSSSNLLAAGGADAKLKKYKKKIKSLQAELEKSRSQITTLSKERDDMFGEMEKIKERSKSVGAGTIAQFAGEVDSLKDQINKLTKEKNELSEHLYMERNQNIKSMNDITQLQNQIITLDATRERSQQEKADLEKQLREARSNASGETAASIVALQTQLDQAREDQQRIQEELTQARTAQQQAQDETRRTFLQLEEERLKCNGIEGTNSRIEQDNKNLREQIQHLEKSILANSEEMDRFNVQEAELNNARDKLKLYDTRDIEYQEKIEALTEQLNEKEKSQEELGAQSQRIKELEKEIEVMSSKESEIRIAMDTMEKEYQSKISSLESKLSNKDDDREESDYSNKITELQEEIAKQKQEFETISKDYEDKIIALERDLGETLDQERAKIREKDAEIKDMEDRIAEFQSELREKEEKIAEYEEKSNEGSAVADESMEAIKRELEVAKKQLEDGNHQINIISTQLNTEKVRASEAERKVEELKDCVNDITRDVSEREQRINELTREIERGQNATSVLAITEEELGELRNKLQFLEEKTSKNKEKKEAYKAKIAKLKETIEQLEEQKEEANEETNKEKEHDAQLQTKLEYTLKELAIYKEEAQSYKEQLEDYKEDTHKKSNTIGEYQKLMSDLQKEVEQLNGQKDKLNEQLLEATETIHTLKDELQELEAAHERAGGEKERNDSSSDEESTDVLREKIEKYKEKIRDLKEELEQKEDEIAEEKVKHEEAIAALESQITAAAAVSATANVVTSDKEKETKMIEEIDNLRQHVKVLKLERDGERQSNIQLAEQVNVIGTKYNELVKEADQLKEKLQQSPPVTSPKQIPDSEIKKELEQFKAIESCVYWPDLEFDRNNVPFCGSTIWTMIMSNGGLSKLSNHVFLSKIINAIEKSYLRSGDDCKLICYWFSTVVHLLHKIHQNALIPKSADPFLSGIEISQELFIQPSPEFGGSFIRDLQLLNLNIYCKLISIIESKLEKVLIPAIFTSQESLFDPSKATKGSGVGNAHKHIGNGNNAMSMNNILIILDSILYFLDEGKVCQLLSNQLLNQTFYFMNSQITNHFLSNQRVCRATVAFTVKMSISRLKEWCSQTIFKNACDQLDSSLEVANLFVVDKSVVVDVEGIRSIFQKLNLLQIKRLLESWRPDELSPDHLPSSLQHAMDLNWRQSPEEMASYSLLIDPTIKLNVDGVVPTKTNNNNLNNHD